LVQDNEEFVMNEPRKYMNEKKVPEPTLKRLPGYLYYLEQARELGILNISAPVIGKDLGCDPTQVVKDLSVTGVRGKPRVGYNTYELIGALEEFLGYNRINEAFLVGAGNLGAALLSYKENQGLGLKILAAFDTDITKTGKTIGGIHVFEYKKIFSLADRLNVKIGIITTPSQVAQVVAEDLVDCGVRAIWNFTSASLTLPEDIIVQNTSISSYAAVLLRRLTDKEK
jgi:redox-sensing transcriptional repressor